MYNVAMDRAALRQEILGPLFQRHVVSLSGTVDERWLESFRAVAADSELFQRYPGSGERARLVHVPSERRARDGRVVSPAPRAFHRDGEPARDLRLGTAGRRDVARVAVRVVRFGVRIRIRIRASGFDSAFPFSPPLGLPTSGSFAIAPDDGSKDDGLRARSLRTILSSQEDGEARI